MNPYRLQAIDNWPTHERTLAALKFVDGISTEVLVNLNKEHFNLVQFIDELAIVQATLDNIHEAIS